MVQTFFKKLFASQKTSLYHHFYCYAGHEVGNWKEESNTSN